MPRVEKATVGRHLWTSGWGWCREQRCMRTYWRRKNEKPEGRHPQGGSNSAVPHSHTAAPMGHPAPSCTSAP